MRTLFITLSLLTILTAETFHVPQDYPTIQAGIDGIRDSDILLVAPGLYAENINFFGKEITVASHYYLENDENFIDQTIINGTTNGPVVTFENGESSDATLLGFSITNGYYNMGGGIHIRDNSNPTIKNSNIFNNHAGDFGGGIYVDDSNPVFIDLNINKNRSDYGSGGGVYCNNSNAIYTRVNVFDNTAAIKGNGLAIYSSAITFNSSNIFLNYAPPMPLDFDENENETEDERINSGGGIHVSSSIINLNECEIYSNSAHAGGGMNANESHVYIFNSIFYDNTAMFENGGGLRLIDCPDVYINSSEIYSHNLIMPSCSGAGIFADNSSVFIDETKIYENQSGCSVGTGAGIYCENFSEIHVKDSKINDNTGKSGGGIYSGDCTITMKRVFITNNEAAAKGGGIFAGLNTDLNLTNVTLADNSASTNPEFGGGGIYSTHGEIQLKNGILWDNTPQQIKYTTTINSNHFLTISYSNVMEGITGIDIEDESYLQWLEGNINSDPLFNNPEDCDYSLTFPSPCINAGDPDTDGDGIPLEPYPDDLDPDGSPADMGAEYYPLMLGDTDDDQNVTVLDLIIIKNIILSASWDNFFNSQIWTADYNEDGWININDIISIVLCIIHNICDDLNMTIAESGQASIYSAYNLEGLSRDAGEFLSIIINSDVPLIGIQFEMNYDTNLELLTDVEIGQVVENFEMGYTDDSGHVKVVIYPEDESLIPPGVQEILILHFEGLNRSDTPFSDILITNVILIDEYGSTVSIHQNNDESEKEHTSFTGFPNPFNPVIQFGFQLPEDDYVKIEIFDINGQSVAVVCNANYSKGKLEVSWDGSEYASGMYFAKLLTTRTELSQKIMLLK